MQVQCRAEGWIPYSVRCQANAKSPSHGCAQADPPDLAWGNCDGIIQLNVVTSYRPIGDARVPRTRRRRAPRGLQAWIFSTHSRNGLLAVIGYPLIREAALPILQLPEFDYLIAQYVREGHH